MYVPPFWSFIPFVALLLCIAILPLVPRLEHWWHRNGNKLLVAAILGVLTLGFYAVVHPGIEHDGHVTKGGGAVMYVLHHAVLDEFIPFIVLLLSLYSISGGILVTGDIQARPWINTMFLLVGTLLASFIGTTGASMLLIRPLLRTNSERRHKVHTVVFYIFLVSNIGGSLTPLGDPPLFLGFLRGVPFWWTAGALLVPWAVTCAILLVVYFIWDTIAYRREEKRDIADDVMHVKPLRISGSINFLWLLGVIACVALVDSSRPLPLIGWTPFPLFRELLLVGLTLISWFTTPGNRDIRESNSFDFFAITEVACLFIGIFICMQPALEYLNLKGSSLGVTEPVHFFWATGIFSSFLDNAPTYVVFFETAKALTAAAPEGFDVLQVSQGVIDQRLLFGISLGAVFMGANTYIGNAPNFMVKSIAEQSGIKMPSFFGYMIFAVIVLMPIFALLTVVFLGD